MNKPNGCSNICPSPHLVFPAIIDTAMVDNCCLTSQDTLEYAIIRLTKSLPTLSLGRLHNGGELVIL